MDRLLSRVGRLVFSVIHLCSKGAQSTANKSHQSIPVLSSIGIDIGKDVFHLAGFDPGGNVVLRRKIKRLALVKEFGKLPANRR